jgi:hypothetical protein
VLALQLTADRHGLVVVAQLVADERPIGPDPGEHDVQVLVLPVVVLHGHVLAAVVAQPPPEVLRDQAQLGLAEPAVLTGEGERDVDDRPDCLPRSNRPPVPQAGPELPSKLGHVPPAHVGSDQHRLVLRVEHVGEQPAERGPAGDGGDHGSPRSCRCTSRTRGISACSSASTSAASGSSPERRLK